MAINFKIFCIGLTSLWTFLFILLPLLMIAVTSLLFNDPINFVEFKFSLNAYLDLFKHPQYLEAFWQSLKLSGISSFLCLLLAYPFAFFLTQLSRSKQLLCLVFLSVPFWINSLVRTYAVKIFLAQKGPLNTLGISLGLWETPIQFLYTQGAVIAGLVYILFPFMALPLYASLEKLDHKLIEAALDLGANKFWVFWKIIFPLSLPGIVAGFILVFLPGLGLFYIADMLGGAKILLLGNVIKGQFFEARNWPLGSAISLFLILLLGIFFLILQKHEERNEQK